MLFYTATNTIISGGMLEQLTEFEDRIIDIFHRADFDFPD